jgi:hypothetical protein
VALAQRGAATEHRLHVAPIKLGQQAEHFGDQQILLQDRWVQLTQAALIGFDDGAKLGG